MRQLPRNFHTHEHGAGHMPPRWMLMPAYGVLPIVRRPLGYEIVYPLHMATMLGAVAFFGFLLMLVYPPAALGPQWLFWFLLMSFVVACCIFAKRAYGQRHGAEIHSAEAGHSFLTYATRLPVPVCEQVIMPVALVALGWGIAHVLSWLLGGFILLSGLSYLLMARWEYRRRWAQQRAPVDDMIRGQTFEQRLSAHERQARSRSRTGSRSTAAAEDADHDVAELGRHAQRSGRPEPAEPPDAAGWSRGSDSVAPDYMTWFRRRGKDSSDA